MVDSFVFFFFNGICNQERKAIDKANTYAQRCHRQEKENSVAGMEMVVAQLQSAHNLS